MIEKLNNCPICKSRDIIPFSETFDVEYYTSKHKYTYSECRSCNAIFLIDPPVDKLGEIYPNNYYAVEGPSSNSSWLMSQLQSAKSKIEKNLFSSCLKKISGMNLSCLDIGGGSGWVMNMVREADKRVTSTTVLDLNPNSKEIAEANGHKFICDLVENISIKDEFDFVIMLNLIEHVKDPRSILLSTYNSMKQNGLLLIKTPNTKSLNRILFKRAYWGGLHAPRHWVLFNKKNFLVLIKECGFSLEFIRYTQGAPQWAASIIGSRRLQYGFIASGKPIYSDKLFAPLNLIFAIIDYLTLPFLGADQMIILLRKK